MPRKHDWIEGKDRHGNKARAIFWDGDAEQARYITNGFGPSIGIDQAGFRQSATPVIRCSCGEAQPGQYLIDYGKGRLYPCAPVLLATVFTPD